MLEVVEHPVEEARDDRIAHGARVDALRIAVVVHRPDREEAGEALPDGHDDEMVAQRGDIEHESERDPSRIGGELSDDPATRAWPGARERRVVRTEGKEGS